MHIALWGYYGSNYGDDIMMDVILKFAKKNGMHISLIDAFDGNLKSKLSLDYKDIEVIPYCSLNKIEKMKVIRKLSKADMNLWGGGTIFTDVDGDGNFKPFFLIKMLGGKFGYLGVGIGDLTKRERIFKTKYLLSFSSNTVFREEKSLKVAKHLMNRRNYQLAEDLAFLYFDKISKINITENSSEDYILITWRNLNGYLPKVKERNLMDDVVCITEQMIKDKIAKKVILVALDTLMDIESCLVLREMFINRNIEVIFDEDSSIDNITDLIKQSTFHISGRLHGSIASEVLGVKTMSLSYSPKIEYFYQSIKKNNYINIYEEKINYLIIRDIIENSLKVSFATQVKSSQLNFKFLNKLS